MYINLFNLTWFNILIFSYSDEKYVLRIKKILEFDELHMNADGMDCVIKWEIPIIASEVVTPVENFKISFYDCQNSPR